MLIDAQRAVANYLEAALAEVESLIGVVYAVRESVNTTNNPLPGDRHVVVVSAREGRSEISFLKDVMLDIYVLSPLDVAGVSVEGAALLEAAVHDCFIARARAAVDADLGEAVAAAVTGWRYSGFFCEGWSEIREETNYVPTLSVKMGLERVVE